VSRFFIVALITGAVASVAVGAHALYGASPAADDEGGASVYFRWRTARANGSCSGVLIDSRAVLTAAHCVRSAELGRLRVRRVRIGNPRGQTVTRRVASVHVHPQFQVDHPDAGNDLAILVLRRPVDGRPPVRLATAAEEPSTQGTDLRVTAYGITRARARSAPGRVLNAITLEYLSPHHCFHGAVAQMAATRMCAASPSAGVCPGDSGGPVLRRVGDEDVLVGVVSLAIDRRVCSEAATVLTRVAPFRDWIRGVLSDTEAIEGDVEG